MTQPDISTQAQKKATLAAWIEAQGQYGVVVNVAGIPIKGDFTRLRRNDEMRGMGDVLSCWFGRFIYLEFKRPKHDSLRDAQIEHKKRTERAQGLHFQISTVDEGIEILEGLRQ